MDWTGCSAGGVATLSCIFPLLANIILWALIAASSVALIYLIIGGIRFLISGGDQKRVDAAKKNLTFAIVGLVLVFLAFFIIKTISQVTGVACLNPGSPLSFTSCIQ